METNTLIIDKTKVIDAFNIILQAKFEYRTEAFINELHNFAWALLEDLTEHGNSFDNERVLNPHIGICPSVYGVSHSLVQQPSDIYDFLKNIFFTIKHKYVYVVTPDEVPYPFGDEDTYYNGFLWEKEGGEARTQFLMCLLEAIEQWPSYFKKYGHLCE